MRDRRDSGHFRSGNANPHAVWAHRRSRSGLSWSALTPPRLVQVSSRLLRFARNDSVNCHCEERSDEAIPPKQALGPNDRAARVGDRRGLFLPVLRPWCDWPRHRDPVDPDLVDQLIEETMMTLDLRAFGDRLGLAPHDVGEHLL